MSYRIKRVNSVIKKELGQIILKEIEFPVNVLVTLTRTDVSADLSRVNVFISTMPYQKSAETIKTLNKEIYFLQQKLDKRLKMRPIPKIIFKIEKKTAQAAEVESILEKIKEKGNN